MFALTKLQNGAAARSAAAVGGALLLAGGGVLGWVATRPAAAVTAAPVPLGEPLDPATAPEALVFVSGAVAHPGLYRLSAAARVADAVADAGGITADADPGHLPDLAARVHDGRQVNVPFRRGGSGRGTTGTRLDLNLATADELTAIPGMPAGLPEAILDYRSTWGRFGSVSDLRTMLGVDSTTLAALRPYLTVGRVQQ